MSKYIKLEDALTAFAEACKGKVLKVLSDHQIIKAFRDNINNLPTIEVSEEVLKATKNFNAYTIADENAEMGMRTMIEPIIEVSEDCISRKAVESLRKYKCIGGELCVDWNEIKELPSVVPSRTEGEWIYIEEPIMDNPYGRYRCSECDIEEPHETDYCPSCGAKMEGAEE